MFFLIFKQKIITNPTILSQYRYFVLNNKPRHLFYRTAVMRFLLVNI